MKMHNPPHPGEVIRGLCLEPLSLTVTGAATALGVSRKTLSAILNGRAGISPEMAVRLSMAFGTSAETWMNQQAQYDLWHAERRRKDFKVTRLAARMPPVEMYTPERIAEFEREAQLEA
jgi:addiction module HigA family antidote